MSSLNNKQDFLGEGKVYIACYTLLYMGKSTTIKISRKMREEIEKRKVHPRQSNQEIVEQALTASGAIVVKKVVEVKSK